MNPKTILIAAAFVAVLVSLSVTYVMHGSDDGAPDMVISDSGGNITGGVYDDVTISESVGDGNVTLSGVTIKGDLIINGGGSNSIILDSVSVLGDVEIDTSYQTRILLKGETVLNRIQSESLFIIQSEPGSKVSKIEAEAGVIVKGDDTVVGSIALADGKKLSLAGGSIGNVSGKDVSIEGTGGSVEEANVSGASKLSSELVVYAKLSGSNPNVEIIGQSEIIVDVSKASNINIASLSAVVTIISDIQKDDVRLNGGDAVTHIFVLIPDVQPDCTHGGYYHVRQCIDCGLQIGGIHVDPLGHVYSASYKWAPDGSSCKVTIECIRSSECGDVIYPPVSEEVTVPPTETTWGTTTYSVSGTYDGFEYASETEIIDIPPL